MKTLAASLKVTTPRGKAVKLAPTRFFRLGKREPTTLVQRKRAIGFFRGRLTTKEERRAIQRARRSKKIKW